MNENQLKVAAIDREKISDRLGLCWAHLDDWENLGIVKRCRRWLEESNAVFTPTTFVAYKGGDAVGMIEFMPHRLLKSVRLCPCRVNEQSGEVEDRYVLGPDFENYLFISCLFVSKDSRGQGVGKTLLNHLLSSEVFQDSDGAFVYVTKRDEEWAGHIHWPTGPKEFYLKAGFAVLKSMENPKGCILIYREGAK